MNRLLLKEHKIRKNFLISALKFLVLHILCWRFSELWIRRFIKKNFPNLCPKSNSFLWFEIKTVSTFPSSSRTRSTSTSISTMLRPLSQTHSSTSEKLPPSLSDIPLSSRLSSEIETSFTVHSYARSTAVIGDQQTVSALGAFNNAELSCQALNDNLRPPTPDPYHYPLRFDIQNSYRCRDYLRDHIIPVNRINSSLQISTFIYFCELTSVFPTTAELNFEVTVKINGLNPNPILTSSQTKHRNFPSPFVVNKLKLTFLTNLHLIINGEEWLCNPISDLQYETTFWKLCFHFLKDYDNILCNI